MARMLMITALLIAGLLLALALYSAWGKARVEQRFPPVGDFVTVDGLRLHYREQGSGSGTPLLLVHGASSNLRDFGRIQPRLADNRRVIAFDRPGYGYSQRPAGEWPDPAQVARLLLDAAAKLGVEKPVVLGHSWAGSVVMAGLVEMPERLAGGVLLSGVAGHWAGSVGWSYDVGGLPVLGPLFARTLVYPAGSRMLDEVVKSVLAPNPVPDGYIEAIGAPLALRPRQFRHNVQDMKRLSVYLQRLSPRYREIDMPLLLIHGTDDELVPFWNHGERLLPVIPQARVAMMPDTGHAPHHARPERTAELLSDFLATQVDARPGD